MRIGNGVFTVLAFINRPFCLLCVMALSLAAYASRADDSHTLTIHYDAVAVTEITYEDGQGKRTVHHPAHSGIFKVKVKPGKGKIIYRLGETFPANPPMASWHGVHFRANDDGIVDFGRSCPTRNGKQLTKGDLMQTGKFTVCIGVDPPGPREDATAVSRNPQLFLDDYLVARTENLRREIQPPKKFEDNPVKLDKRYPWEMGTVRCSTVIYEPESNKFRMWYTAFARNPPGDYQARACYAESDDGITWRKPMLDICEFEGRRPTNILLDGPGETLNISVVKTPHDDPQRLYKGFFTHRRYKRAPGIYGLLVTTSPDGIHWTKPKQVIYCKADNSPSLVWMPSEGKYLAAMRAQATHPKLGGYWRVTGISQSRNFDDWTPKKTFVLTDDRDGYPQMQFHDVQLTTYGDVVIGLASAMHLKKNVKDNKTSTANIQLVSTRNGHQWHRVADRAVFIDNGPGKYDRGLVMASSTMAVKDDTIYIYYHGMQYGMGRRNPIYPGKGKPAQGELGGICLATLPADRFVAMRPVKTDSTGELLTKSLRLPGGELLLNADAEDGDLQVELLDGKGRVLGGFEGDKSRLMKQDRLRHRVVWQSGDEQKSLKDAPTNQPLALRFLLKKGSLYAFQVK